MPETTTTLFTGKMRDAETNLDNFEARYYSSALGRFMIPDWDAKATAVPYAAYGNPQTLNLYGYVGNNPITETDATGHAGDSPPAQFPIYGAEPLDVTGGDNAHWELQVDVDPSLLNDHAGESGLNDELDNLTNPVAFLLQIVQQVTFFNSNGSAVSTVEISTQLNVTANPVTGAIVTASGSSVASNVSGAAFSSSKLTTIASTISAVLSTGASMHLGPDPFHLMTAIAAQESSLGTHPGTANNPLQLSGSSGNPPNGDRQHNIQGALNVLQGAVKRAHSDPARTYWYYNAVRDLGQRASNVASFMRFYNGMSQSQWIWK